MEVRPGCDLVETRRAVCRAWGQATFGESRASATDETWSVSHTLNIYGVRVWTLCKQGKGVMFPNSMDSCRKKRCPSHSIRTVDDQRVGLQLLTHWKNMPQENDISPKDNPQDNQHRS